MKRTKLAGIAATVAVAVCTTGATWGALAATPAAAARPPIVMRPLVKSGCVTFDVTGHPAVGMPFDEPLHFCGPGMRAGNWLCITTKPDLGPGSRLNCSREP